MTYPKIFKISQEKLEEIIHKVLEEYLKSIQPKERNFRIEGEIPDISELVKSLRFSNPNLFKNELKEGLIQTYDINKVKDIVCRKFNLNPDQFSVDSVTENGTTINLVSIVLDSKVSKNEIGDIINLMRTCGYFEYQEHRNYGAFKIYVFEPRYSEDVTDKVRQKYHYLFHATPTIYVQKILKNGLVPRHRNTLFLYPSRVYCMAGNNLSREQIYTIKNIKAERGQKRLHDSNHYTILKIDISEIPDNVKFFADPMEKDSIYTHNNIPPQAISVYGELQ